MKYLFDASETDAAQLSHVSENQLDFISYVKNQLLEILKKGGPEVAEYALMDDLMKVLYLDYKNGGITQTDIETLKSVFDESFL